MGWYFPGPSLSLHVGQRPRLWRHTARHGSQNTWPHTVETSPRSEGGWGEDSIKSSEILPLLLISFNESRHTGHWMMEDSVSGVALPVSAESAIAARDTAPPVPAGWWAASSGATSTVVPSLLREAVILSMNAAETEAGLSSSESSVKSESVINSGY